MAAQLACTLIERAAKDLSDAGKEKLYHSIFINVAKKDSWTEGEWVFLKKGMALKDLNKYCPILCSRISYLTYTAITNRFNEIGSDVWQVMQQGQVPDNIYIASKKESHDLIINNINRLTPGDAKKFHDEIAERAAQGKSWSFIKKNTGRFCLFDYGNTTTFNTIGESLMKKIDENFTSQNNLKNV